MAPQNALTKLFLEWPVVRQLLSGDLLGRGPAVTSAHTRAMTPRTTTADRVVQSVCPYCAVGCGQRVYVKDEKVVQIEGDPDSPISRGRLCPKGSASEQLVNSPGRQTEVLYRAPHATEWQRLDRDTAIDMVADRVHRGAPPRLAAASTSRGACCAARWASPRLGGATLDNEENYLIKKLFTAARRGPDREPGPHMTLLHGSRSGNLVRARRRHASLQDMANADCIVIQGSNMAECHPVGFQWVDGGQGARGDGDPRRSPLHPDLGGVPTSTSRSGPAGHRAASAR